MSRAWYVFIGNDPIASSNYYRVSGHNCLCGEQICCIYLYDNGLRPKDPLSPNIQNYIREALATGQLQPARPYSAKKYVYLKG